MNSPKCNLHHFFQGTVVNLAYPFNWKVTWNFNIKKNNNYICTIIGSSKIVCSLKYSKKNLKNAKCQFQFRRKRCMTEIFYENFQIFLRYNKLKLFPIPILTFYNCWFSRRKFSRIFFHIQICGFSKILTVDNYSIYQPYTLPIGSAVFTFIGYKPDLPI